MLRKKSGRRRKSEFTILPGVSKTPALRPRINILIVTTRFSPEHDNLELVQRRSVPQHRNDLPQAEDHDQRHPPGIGISENVRGVRNVLEREPELVMNTMMRMQKGRRTKITINLDDFELCGFGQAGTTLRPIV